MCGSRVHYENRVGQDGPTRQMVWATREICMGPLQPIAAVDSRPAFSWRLHEDSARLSRDTWMGRGSRRVEDPTWILFHLPTAMVRTPMGGNECVTGIPYLIRSYKFSSLQE